MSRNRVGVRFIVYEVIICDDIIKEVFFGKLMEDNGNRFIVYLIIVYFYE